MCSVTHALACGLNTRASFWFVFLKRCLRLTQHTVISVHLWSSGSQVPHLSRLKQKDRRKMICAMAPINNNWFSCVPAFLTSPGSHLLPNSLSDGRFWTQEGVLHNSAYDFRRPWMLHFNCQVPSPVCMLVVRAEKCWLSFPLLKCLLLNSFQGCPATQMIYLYKLFLTWNSQLQKAFSRLQGSWLCIDFRVTKCSSLARIGLVFHSTP